MPDDIEVQRKSNLAKSQKLDFLSGQQCIRDFFICLELNNCSLPEVASLFAFSTTNSSICCACEQKMQSTSEQLYIELFVPPDNSNLNEHIEEYFNMSELLGRVCEDGCKAFTQAEKRNQLTGGSQTKFILVILARGIASEDGFSSNRNKVLATNDVFIR